MAYNWAQNKAWDMGLQWPLFHPPSSQILNHSFKKYNEMDSHFIDWLKKKKKKNDIIEMAWIH